MIEFLFHSRREAHIGILGFADFFGRVVNLGLLLGFPDDFTGIFVIPHSDELGVPKVVGPGPLQELDLSDGIGLEPNTLLHLLRSKALTPPPRCGLWEIGEWALCSREVLDLVEDFPTSGGDEACADARCVYQFLTSIEAYDQGIEAEIAWQVSSDDELLAEIDAVL